MKILIFIQRSKNWHFREAKKPAWSHITPKRILIFSILNFFLMFPPCTHPPDTNLDFRVDKNFKNDYIPNCSRIPEAMHSVSNTASFCYWQGGQHCKHWVQLEERSDSIERGRWSTYIKAWQRIIACAANGISR